MNIDMLVCVCVADSNSVIIIACTSLTQVAVSTSDCTTEDACVRRHAAAPTSLRWCNNITSSVTYNVFC